MIITSECLIHNIEFVGLIYKCAKTKENKVIDLRERRGKEGKEKEK